MNQPAPLAGPGSVDGGVGLAEEASEPSAGEHSLSRSGRMLWSAATGKPRPLLPPPRPDPAAQLRTGAPSLARYRPTRTWAT